MDNILVENIYGHGAIPEPQAPETPHIKEVGFSSIPFDWSKGYDVEEDLNIIIKTKDQGQSGSCGGQAWSYDDAVKHASDNGLYSEKSAKYIYAQTFVSGGGSSGVDNSNIVKNQGVASEILTSSYDNGNPPSEAFMERSQDITPAARQDAISGKIFSSATCAVLIDDIAQNVRDNHGLIIGIGGSNNGTWLTSYPKPPKMPTWWHWLYVGRAKMINGKKYIGVKNSWGDTVGDKGWQWLGEDYVNPVDIFNVWIMVNKSSDNYLFTKTIKYGQRNLDVAHLQMKLQKLGFFPADTNCTGYFGDVTARAVVAFQISNGILDFQGAKLKTVQAGPKTVSLLNK